MGWFTSLFGAAPAPQEQLQKAVQRALSESERAGLNRLVRGRYPTFERDLSGIIRGQGRTMAYEHEREERDLEYQHKTYQRPDFIRQLNKSYLLPENEQELAQLKAAGSPYATQKEASVKYLRDEVNKRIGYYDKDWEKSKYDRKYQRQYQRDEAGRQLHEQGYMQLEDAKMRQQKQQAINRAINTQSNTPGRGGRGEQPLGRGQRHRGFNPPAARGSFGRGRQQQRPSFTRAGK